MEDRHMNQNKPDSKDKKIPCFFFYVESKQNKNTHNNNKKIEETGIQSPVQYPNNQTKQSSIKLQFLLKDVTECSSVFRFLQSSMKN